MGEELIPFTAVICTMLSVALLGLWWSVKGLKSSQSGAAVTGLVLSILNLAFTAFLFAISGFAGALRHL